MSDAGITTLLALSVYQMIVNEKLPSTSDAIPLMGKVKPQILEWAYNTGLKRRPGCDLILLKARGFYSRIYGNRTMRIE